MTLTLISEQEHLMLANIQAQYPKLTYQNKGYDSLVKTTLSEEELAKFKEVENLLSKSITGFSMSNHFTISKSGKVKVRFQYDYTADEPTFKVPFTGVGYLEIDELLHGFKVEEIKN